MSAEYRSIWSPSPVMDTSENFSSGKKPKQKTIKRNKKENKLRLLYKKFSLKEIYNLTHYHNRSSLLSTILK